MTSEGPGAAFDEIVASADPAMVVVTVADENERAGCLVGFHTQGGIDPLRYCLWISKANHSFGVMQRSDAMAVHFLSRNDKDIASLFGEQTGENVDKFATIEFDDHPAGPPLVRRLPNWIVGQRVSSIDDSGDHVCVTIEVTDASQRGDLTPLRLSDVKDFHAGHAADDAINN